MASAYVLDGDKRTEKPRPEEEASERGPSRIEDALERWTSTSNIAKKRGLDTHRRGRGPPSKLLSRTHEPPSRRSGVNWRAASQAGFGVDWGQGKRTDDRASALISMYADLGGRVSYTTLEGAHEALTGQKSRSR